MSLPTISLALIAKNEEKNINRLLDSVKDCFNEIILVDTGSTDRTVEIAKERGCKVHHFLWVNSFSKARNFAFSKATCDYVMWLDLDDVLHNREAFIKWRDTAMEFNGAWFATYNYAMDAFNKPIVSFVRERVFRRSLNPEWNYDLHEGIVVRPEWSPSYAVSWAVNHMRDIEDIKADKSRNIQILSEMKHKDARMKFYYGKELYEAARPFEAVVAFDDALKENLEHHDRILSYQYGAYSAMSCFDSLKDDKKEEKTHMAERSINYCFEGIKLAPNRAEFHVALGDMYLKLGRYIDAIPYFSAAKNCVNPKSGGSKYEGAIYSFLNCYGEMPSLQLSKIYAHVGDFDKAKREAMECFTVHKNEEAKKVFEEIERIQNLTKVDNNQDQTEDILITCPPQQAYEFDEELYKTKGMGGSETALIEMAKNLRLITGRKVKVFNTRKDDLRSESGVEYISNVKINDYLSKYKPHTHIAWRHNIKLTTAKTYLWCHDLVTQSVESYQNFDKILCLSKFHKDYVMAMQGIEEDKIVLTRNGIVPEKFDFERKPKNKNKLVWMSSPDRGLEKAMLVCDKLKEKHPDIELHVYYGLDNLYKYGLAALADKLNTMMKDRPYVKYHGFTEQNKMYREVSDAVLWLHPCNFIETFCITALEMLALGVYPVTRKLGALANTLEDAEKNGMATMLDHDCVTEKELMAYVDAADSALKEKKWERVGLNTEKHSWSNVAKEWANMMEL